MSQADVLNTFQEGVALGYRRFCFVKCDFLNHRVKNDYLTGQQLHKSSFNQLVDEVHVFKLEPKCD